MSERGSAARDMSPGGFDSPKRMARQDRAKIKKKGIKSPDTTKMHSVTYGGTAYFFRSRRKMNAFIKEEKHKLLMGIKIHQDDAHKPSIEEKFNFLNKNNKSDEQA